MASATGPAPDGSSEAATLVPPSIAPVPRRRGPSPLSTSAFSGTISPSDSGARHGGAPRPGARAPRGHRRDRRGSLIGCLPLAAVALAGAREGLPGMVLFRPVLGRTGSFAPSVLNVAQLIGWTSVEFWAMGRLANTVSIELFGLDAFWLWLGLTAVACTALAIGGPVLVVKRFLERFGTWIVLATGFLLTISLVALRFDRTVVVRSRPGRSPVLARRGPRDRDADLVAPFGCRFDPIRAEPARCVRGDLRRVLGRERVVLCARSAHGSERGRHPERARDRRRDPRLRRGHGGDPDPRADRR